MQTIKSVSCELKSNQECLINSFLVASRINCNAISIQRKRCILIFLNIFCICIDFSFHLSYEDSLIAQLNLNLNRLKNTNAIKTLITCVTKDIEKTCKQCSCGSLKQREGERIRPSYAFLHKIIAFWMICNNWNYLLLLLPGKKYCWSLKNIEFF